MCPQVPGCLSEYVSSRSGAPAAGASETRERTHGAAAGGLGVATRARPCVRGVLCAVYAAETSGPGESLAVSGRMADGSLRPSAIGVAGVSVVPRLPPEAVLAEERLDRGVDLPVLRGAEPAVSAALDRDELIRHAPFVQQLVQAWSYSTMGSASPWMVRIGGVSRSGGSGGWSGEAAGSI